MSKLFIFLHFCPYFTKTKRYITFVRLLLVLNEQKPFMKNNFFLNRWKQKGFYFSVHRTIFLYTLLHVLLLVHIQKGLWFVFNSFGKQAENNVLIRHFKTTTFINITFYIKPIKWHKQYQLCPNKYKSDIIFSYAISFTI